MAKVSANMDYPLCTECAGLFDENDFYKISANKFIPICKDCCEKIILGENNDIDINKFKELLQKLDMVFNYGCWDEIKSSEPPYFEKYIALLKRKKLITKKFKDSDAEINTETTQADKELMDKWGVKNKEDIEFLERSYHEWETCYEIDSKAMVDSVMQLCLIELDTRKARARGNIADLNNLIRAKSQILGDANLKPVQETGNAANDQIGIGLLIKKLEQERPVPEDKEPDWIDEMKTWIVGQLARMEGFQSDVTDEFNKELAKYGMGDELDHIGDDMNA